MRKGYVCLLRGVNVGGKALNMAALRTALEHAGFGSVTTYIQSGNVILSLDRSDELGIEARMERTIAAEFGLDVTVLMRSADELDRISLQAPFGDRRTNPRCLHLTFLASTPAEKAVAAVNAEHYAPDEFRFIGREIFLHCPEGYGRSKLNNTFWERRLGLRATTRNWNTVLRLTELAHGTVQVS